MSTAVQPQALPEVDTRLQRALERLGRKERDYWSFRFGREAAEQPYFEYPARMVAPLQRDLLRLIKSLQPGIGTCLEPFAGSGTILVECMVQGLSATGHDINPLAVLLCRARTADVASEVLRTACDAVMADARADASTRVDVAFPGLDKWFRGRTQVQLSRLRRAIERIRNVTIRRFLWVCLAETIRRTSNSRTSTYKLHIRPDPEIRELPSPLTVFPDVCATNLARHQHTIERLKDAGRTEDRPRVSVLLRDSMKPAHGMFDLVMTSPPYGDNTSTVPYGQQAYLPLQWLCLDDIDGGLSRHDFLRTTHEIDRLSLGGEKFRGDFSARFGDLMGRSEAIEHLVSSLSAAPLDRINRVLSFLLDLDIAGRAIAASLRPNGYAMWTVGNRRVGNQEVALNAILVDLFAAHGLCPVAQVSRRIPTKRMPTRNSHSSTMNSEVVVIFRKEG